MRKFILYFILCVCLIITGCSSNKEREVTTTTDFSNASKNNNFSVKSNMDKYNKADYITDSMIAIYEEDVEVEMVVYSNSDYALQVQEQQIEGFNLLKSSTAFVEKEKGANYYDYSLVSNNRYMVSTRVDNTLIFAKVKLEYKDMVDKLINSLGY